MLLADAISPPVYLHTLLTGWQTDWLSLLAFAVDVALGSAYVFGTIRLSKKGRHWSPWRTGSFLAGILTIAIATFSGLASYDDSVFSIHVIQHLLLMNLAPIFLVLGAPVTLALQASGRPTQTSILKVLHHPVVEFVTNPLVVLFFFSVTMIGYFLTPFYQFSLEHPLLHDFTHLQFLITGCLYWWLVLGIDPSRWHLSYPMKLGFLALDIPVGTLLGLGLTQATTSIAPSFHTLADTKAGGGILWVASELITFAAIGIVAYQWMRSDTREAERGDRRADAAYATRISEQSAEPELAAAGVDLELTQVQVVEGRFVDVSRPGSPVENE
jgi:putative copper resistance protein D